MGKKKERGVEVSSFAIVTDGVFFRRKEAHEERPNALLLINNPTPLRQIFKVKTTCNRMFIIRPTVFDVEEHSERPVKITYVPEKETADEQKEDQWFAIYSKSAPDSNKTAEQCWKDDSRPEKIKHLRARFDAMLSEEPKRRRSITTSTSSNSSTIYESDGSDVCDPSEIPVMHRPTTLQCVPSRTVLFESINGPNMKRLFTTMSFINPTEVRRAVQVFCPIDPKFHRFHAKMFTVEPFSQYDLTLCFLPSQSFREEAKSNKPYIAVTHIQATDSKKTAKEIWDEHNKTPNARYELKRIPIEYDESELDAILDGREIDPSYIANLNSSSSSASVGSVSSQNHLSTAREFEKSDDEHVSADRQSSTMKRREEVTGVEAFERNSEGEEESEGASDEDSHSDENDRPLRM